MDAVKSKLKAVKADIQDRLASFTKDFGKFYKDAIVTDVIENSGNEEEGASDDADAGEARALTSRPEAERQQDNVPLKTGVFLKRGANVKNWKERYFVVLPNYWVQYYESEEAYNEGAKPKGTMLLDGYEVFRDPNSRKIQAKTALNKQLGIEQSEPIEYSKYAPLTLEVFHEGRRRWLLQFEDQETFDEWAEMLTSCTKLCESGVLEEPIAKSAFAEAFLEQKRQCMVPTHDEYGGSEVEQLVQLFTRHCRRKFMDGISFPGGAKVKKVMYGKAVALYRTTIGALVAVAWPLLLKACSAAKGLITKVATKGFGPVIKARRSLIGKSTDQLIAKMEPIKVKVLTPLATVVAQAVGPSTLKSLSLAKPVYQTHTKAYVEQVQAGDDVADSQTALAKACVSNHNLHLALEESAKLDSLLRTALAKLPDALKSNLGEFLATVDDVMEPDTWVLETQEQIRVLCDNAGYTYQLDVGEDGDKVKEAAPTVDASTEAKFDHDAKLVAIERVTALIAPALSYLFKTKLTQEVTPLEESLVKWIPDLAKEVLQPSGIVDAVFDGVAEQAAKEAATTVLSGL
eukprot:m.101466 g.101466  ORF g.101466 m.101466 type:complete len:573 (-) comp15171_c0_seq1:99-1817(-)